jgi:hypothetical protein
LLQNQLMSMHLLLQISRWTWICCFKIFSWTWIHCFKLFWGTSVYYFKMFSWAW